MVESDEYFEALGQADEQFRLAVRYKLELGLRAIFRADGQVAGSSEHSPCAGSELVRFPDPPD